MDQLLTELRRTAVRWRTEHALVADDAAATNVRRLRFFCPAVAVVNGLAALILTAQGLHQSLANGGEWDAGLALTQLGMGLWMASAAYLAHTLRHKRHGLLPRLLTWGVVVAVMVFAWQMTQQDPQHNAGLTPFLLATLCCSLVVYLSPTVAAAVFGAGCVAFGALDPSAASSAHPLAYAVLLAVLAWSLSCLLWRKFCIVRLQKAELEKMQQELRARQKDLERLTRQDGLTGLYNRNTFVELTRKELQRAQRQGSATTILLLDLDHFKRINDTWGHPAGDAVLRHVATLVSDTVRSTDLTGRLGGEEFIVLLPGTPSEPARKIAEKIRLRLESSPVLWDNQRIRVTASIGLCGTTAAERRDFDTLYNEADKALYLAKQRGRNRVM